MIGDELAELERIRQRLIETEALRERAHDIIRRLRQSGVPKWRIAPAFGISEARVKQIAPGVPSWIANSGPRGKNRLVSSDAEALSYSGTRPLTDDERDELARLIDGQRRDAATYRASYGISVEKLAGSGVLLACFDRPEDEAAYRAAQGRRRTG